MTLTNDEENLKQWHRDESSSARVIQMTVHLVYMKNDGRPVFEGIPVKI